MVVVRRLAVEVAKVGWWAGCVETEPLECSIQPRNYLLFALSAMLPLNVEDSGRTIGRRVRRYTLLILNALGERAIVI